MPGAFSPEPQKQDKGHQEGHEGDAVAQVVDDDGDVVMQLALLLRPERGVEVRPRTATPLHPLGRVRTAPERGRDRVVLYQE